MGARFSLSGAAVPLATAGRSGLLSKADFAKLAGLAIPVQRLSYAAAADLANGLAVAATTWTDVVPNQNFTVGSATALLLVGVRFSCGIINGAVGNSGFGARVMYDSATSATTAKLAGAAALTSGYTALVGGGLFVSGATAATHTVKVQIYGGQAFTAYCRASTAPNQEWAEITIWEVSA